MWEVDSEVHSRMCDWMKVETALVCIVQYTVTCLSYYLESNSDAWIHAVGANANLRFKEVYKPRRLFERRELKNVGMCFLG